MKANQILEAADVLGWLASVANGLHEAQREAFQTSLTLTMAQSFLVTYAGHLSCGIDPYDALVATLRETEPQGDEEPTQPGALTP